MWHKCNVMFISFDDTTQKQVLEKSSFSDISLKDTQQCLHKFQARSVCWAKSLGKAMPCYIVILLFMYQSAITLKPTTNYDVQILLPPKELSADKTSIQRDGNWCLLISGTMTAIEAASVPVNYVAVVMLLIIISPTQTTNVQMDSSLVNLVAMVK